jgi:hypothetical protein
LPVSYSGNKLYITVSTIGTIAREALAQARQARVIGNTSRGVFLHLQTDWVVFLSFEPYRSPLTLNLVGKTADLGTLETSAFAKCSTEQIYFPAIQSTVLLNRAESWHAPNPAQTGLPWSELKARLLLVLRLATQERPDHKLVNLLDGMLRGQPASYLADSEFYPLLSRLLALAQNGDRAAVADSLQAFLGLGDGLTPSGDDLVMGYLLAMSRWGNRPTDPDMTSIASRLSPRLSLLTTHLSASLIRCAWRGQADERLIVSLDGLVTGSMPVEDCVSTLSTWGSSSGMDALTGMVVFFFQS